MAFIWRTTECQQTFLKLARQARPGCELASFSCWGPINDKIIEPCWEPLRRQHVEAYRDLMIDPLHVNPLGNMVMGLDLIRRFEARLEEVQMAYCAEGLRYQGWMDELVEGTGHFSKGGFGHV